MFDEKRVLGLSFFEWSCWLGGVAVWALFLFVGNMHYTADDWPLTFQRFTVIKTALEEWRWPFYASLFPQELKSGVFYYVNEGRFLADVNLVTSPHLVFLKWLTVPQFFLFHISLLMLVGHFGLCAIRRRFYFSPPAFLLVFMLCFFGGYFSSKIAIGHLINAGFFLWPWIFYLSWKVFESAQTNETGNAWRNVCYLGLLLLAVLMQGSFHIYFHMLLFLSLCLVLSWKSFRYFLSGILLSILLAGYRIIPAYFLDGHAQTKRIPHAGLGAWFSPHLGASHSGLIPEFWISGFIEALAVLRGPRFLEAQYYWELDAFIGWSGLLILIVGTFYLLRTKKIDWSFSNAHIKMTVVAFVFFVLSLHMFFSYLFQFALIPLGFPVGERVPSRFIIIPLLFMILVGCFGFDLWLKERSSKMRKWVAGISIAAVITSLSAHLWLWLPSRTESTYPTDELKGTFLEGLSLNAVIMNKAAEPHYINLLLIGLGVSLVGIIIWIVLFNRTKKDFNLVREGGFEPPQP